MHLYVKWDATNEEEDEEENKHNFTTEQDLTNMLNDIKVVNE